MSEVWCPRFLVADPTSWPIILAICTTIIFIISVGSVVLLCGGFTFMILISSRNDLSSFTLRAQKKFTTVLIIQVEIFELMLTKSRFQAIVHVVFILGPILGIVVSVYFEISIKGELMEAGVIENSRQLTFKKCNIN